MTATVQYKEDGFFLDIREGEAHYDIRLNKEELEQLYRDINDAIEESKERFDEYIWNPRSRRHEKVRK
jgi:hypothetical protein